MALRLSVFRKDAANTHMCGDIRHQPKAFREVQGGDMGEHVLAQSMHCSLVQLEAYCVFRAAENPLLQPAAKEGWEYAGARSWEPGRVLCAVCRIALDSSFINLQHKKGWRCTGAQNGDRGSEAAQAGCAEEGENQTDGKLLVQRVGSQAGCYVMFGDTLVHWMDGE